LLYRLYADMALAVTFREEMNMLKKDNVIKPATKKLTLDDLKQVTGGRKPVDDCFARAEDRAGNKAESGFTGE
jgi:hypothetical protein